MSFMRRYNSIAEDGKVTPVSDATGTVQPAATEWSPDLADNHRRYGVESEEAARNVYGRAVNAYRRTKDPAMKAEAERLRGLLGERGPLPEEEPAASSQSAPMQQPQAEAPSGGGFMRRYNNNSRTDDAQPGMPQPKAAPNKFGIDWNKSKGEVRAAIEALPPEQRREAMNQWATAFVAKERSAPGGVQRYVGDVARNLIRGTVGGSFFDEVNAGVSSLTGAAPYEESLAYERAYNKAIDDESTKLGKLPLIGDVTVGGVQKLAGGIASAPVTPVVNAFRGANILSRVGNAAVTGATYGAVAGAGEAETNAATPLNALGGAAMGGAIGFAVPLAARAVSGTVNALNPTMNPPRAVGTYHPAAVRRMRDLVSADELNAPRAATAYGVQAARLGDDGMLADMGPKLRGATGGIASLPGQEGSIVHRALTRRAEGARRRIEATLQRTIGAARNMVTEVAGRVATSRAAADPLYDAYRATPIPTDPAAIGPLMPILERARAAGVVNGATRDMRTEGLDPLQPQNLWTFLDYLKRNTDTLIAAEVAAPAPSANRIRILERLRDNLVTQVDNLNPNYAPARAAAAPGLQFQEGTRQGGKAFRDNLTPDQVAADIAGMPAPQVEGYRSAAQETLRNRMGNASTSFGDNGPAAIRRELGDQNARRKLVQVTDPGSAREITRRLDAESQFQNTYNRALTNSETAPRQAVQRDLGYNTDQNFYGSIRSTTPTGLIIEGVTRIANMLTNGAVNERKQAIATDMARMLVAQGMQRDEIARALLTMAQNQNMRGQQRQAIEQVVQHVMAGSRQQAIGQTLGAPTQSNPTGR